ncbi:MAG: hypothetical protein JO235_28035 [Chroococcidiopsidaceae cyanobacterium CP_BM_RX_35]|nr:hypothetical protein [Chroococcidiopsidaceae cyanobacterium CP_BM_RX_35]
MDYVLLNLGKAASLVTNIQVTKWGSNVVVSCLYDPLGASQPYQLIFRECREVRWQTVELENVHESTADLIGFSVGAGAYQEAAVLTTDVFELSIIYSDFVFQKIDKGSFVQLKGFKSFYVKPSS